MAGGAGESLRANEVWGLVVYESFAPMRYRGLVVFKALVHFCAMKEGELAIYYSFCAIRYRELVVY